MVVNEGELSVPGNNQRCSNYGYTTRHGPFNTYAKYHCFKLEHVVVMNIWNIDAWHRQKCLTLAVSCYFMSLSDKVSHLLDSIMLLSQIIATMISTVKFERNNRPFTIEDILKGEFNWNMNEITLPCYVINICILYRLHFKQHDSLKEVLIGYPHADFHHVTTFGCRNIAFQIWWLPCNPHRSEWPKTFFGRCMLWLQCVVSISGKKMACIHTSDVKMIYVVWIQISAILNVTSSLILFVGWSIMMFFSCCWCMYDLYSSCIFILLYSSLFSIQWLSVINPAWDTINSWYIAVQYNMKLHTSQQLWRYNFGHTSNSRKTPIPGPNGRALCVFRELCGENWPRDIGNALCPVYMYMAVLCFVVLRLEHTVYPKKYAHGFVVLCFVVVMQSFIMNSHEVFIHIHQGCFAGTGAIVRLPQCQWSKPDGYGKIRKCITTTKHSKAKTVCIFLGIYCIPWIFIIFFSVASLALTKASELGTHIRRVHFL